MGVLLKYGTTFNQKQIISYQKVLCISYLLSLSDVEKFTIVAKDSSNASFLIPGEDGVQGCVVSWGSMGGGYQWGNGRGYTYGQGDTTILKNLVGI